MADAYINRIATAVPDHEIHRRFVDYACDQLSADAKKAKLFRRMSDMGGIERRYSVLSNMGAEGDLDVEAFYATNGFPSTAARMRVFKEQAPLLAQKAVEALELGEDRSGITHLVMTSCTGMSAPGVDLEIIERCGLPSTVERTMVGFMGCYAAINALKLARHIVRSEPEAKVLVLNVELCSLHLQDSKDLEQILSFFLFADGCAASLVTAEPVGFRMDSFHAVLAPETTELITWNVGDSGFDMLLSGKVPAAIRDALDGRADEILKGVPLNDIDLWAVHPGGRTVLDAVQTALELPPESLLASRQTLRDYGNMSSPTVVFVMKRLMESAVPDQQGCAMAFGPGLVAETMLFRTAA